MLDYLSWKALGYCSSLSENQKWFAYCKQRSNSNRRPQHGQGLRGWFCQQWFGDSGAYTKVLNGRYVTALAKFDDSGNCVWLGHYNKGVRREK